MSITIENLTYTYQPQTPFAAVSLQDINLAIADGELVGLIGETGSGKSTLAQIVAGLLPVKSGTVRVGGKMLHEKTRPTDLLGKVGMVFQYPEQQLFATTVFEDIAFGPGNMGLPPKEIETRVEKAAGEVGLKSELLQANPLRLSGGEKRRVALAGILAMQPELLILDEPLAGLDQKGKEDLLQIITHYHQKPKKTVLWIAHSMEEIASVAKRVLVLHEGRLVADDTPENLFPREEFLNANGLTAPIPTQVVLRLKRHHWPLAAQAISVATAKAEILSCLREGCR